MKPQSRFQAEQKTFKVSPAVWDRVTAIKAGLEADKTRQVTYSETIEILADAWDRWQALTAAAEAGQ